jgi:hypothetical protein
MHSLTIAIARKPDSDHRQINLRHSFPALSFRLGGLGAGLPVEELGPPC